MASSTRASPMTGRTTWLSRWVLGYSAFQGEAEGPFPALIQSHHKVVPLLDLALRPLVNGATCTVTPMQVKDWQCQSISKTGGCGVSEKH